MHMYRKKTVMLLVALMLVFFAVFLIALYDLVKGIPILDIGFSAQTINWVVMLLSAMSIVKVIVEIAGVEGHKDFEKRVRSSREVFK